MTDDRFGPPPTISYERAPSKQEIEFFRENGFLAVERITTDEGNRVRRLIDPVRPFPVNLLRD